VTIDFKRLYIFNLLLSDSVSQSAVSLTYKLCVFVNGKFLKQLMKQVQACLHYLVFFFLQFIVLFLDCTTLRIGSKKLLCFFQQLGKNCMLRNLTIYIYHHLILGR
jgi:hypothetical protein